MQWREEKGHWRARYRHKGDRYEKVFKTQGEAETWLAGEAEKLLTTNWVAPGDSAQLFVGVLAAWWDTRLVEPGTSERDRSVLETHVVPALGAIPVGEVDYHVMLKMVRTMQQAGYSAAHVRRAYGLTRQVLTYAQRRRWIAQLPPAVEKLPTVRHRRIEPLTLEEVWATAEAIDSRYRALVLTAGFTGARIGEVLGLRVTNLNLLHRVMVVVEDLENVRGRVRVGAPLKNEGSRRVVTLPQVLVDELQTHLELFPPAPSGLVFTGPHGAPIRIDNWRRRHWRPAVEQGAGRYVTPYELRHAQASELIARGLSATDIASRLGNSTRVVQDVYGHQFAQRDRLAADLLDRAFAESSPHSPPKPVAN